ncbi:hypothetical protein [Longivirga aurantiaca]|uniref:Uncharacterized protein n=1 Tax=Longivirga aurantiaca TaxID=1837743 RepID=A0ABW1T4P6_9ACTN
MSTATEPHGASTTSIVAVVLLTVAGLVLLLLPAYLLVWFSAAFSRGASCDVGLTAWCRPGWGMRQLWALLAMVVVALALLVASWVTLARGQGRRAVRLVVIGAACALLAVAVATAGAWADPFLPDGWVV